MAEWVYAPGWPGLPVRWTSGNKSGVGTALNTGSRVWFTLSHGIFDEIFFPRVDRACTRDLGLIVTDGREFFSEEKRHAEHETHYLADGVPAYCLVNTCRQRRYRIEKEILTHPRHDAVLQLTRFTALQGNLGDYHLYALLAPHLDNHGAGNTAWVDDYKGVPMLFAERGGYALALACSAPWLARSVGFAGASDGWQDLAAHKRMTWSYTRAENGNVALTGEVHLGASDGVFLLAVGFGSSAAEAGHRARACLLADFEAVKRDYIEEWRAGQRSLLAVEADGRELYRISAAVLHTHEAKAFRGGTIASLAIPWGASKGDNDLGGYHLVWIRDLVETVGGLLALGAQAAALRALRYLQVTQELDGHWPQNMWLDGTPYWYGVQMDEVAFPILLTATAWRERLLEPSQLAGFWPMVSRAAGYLVRNGPVTQQDRWEEDAGYSPFTLAVEIAALLSAAVLADAAGEPEMAAYLRETADTWNDNIERWTYARETALARRLGVEGYYVRLTPPAAPDLASPVQGAIPLRNRPAGQNLAPAAEIVSPDALALVRFGLRAADDPRIVNTVKAIDALLKVETPRGTAWHRYNADGYGEHADGSAYDGTGIGRAWPLLTGERGHYELAAGRRDEAERLRRAMEAFANEGGMIPEQIWDAPDIPEKELYCGGPSGSATPLAWAHAEYVKLCRSLEEGRVFDTPPETVQRYLVQRTHSPFGTWRFNNKTRTLPVGKTLRIETLAPARIHWSDDDWRTVHDDDTRDTRLDVHIADLPTRGLPAGRRIVFTFYWPAAGRWEGEDFTVVVEEAPSAVARNGREQWQGGGFARGTNR